MAIECSADVPPAWDEYAARHPLGSAYHRGAAVRVGARTFGLPTFYLSSRGSDGQPNGILPLIEQSSVVFGRYIVSLPFVSYGGILADNVEVATDLARAAGELAVRRRARHVELRHAAPVLSGAFPERLDKVSMVLELPATESELGQQLGSKLRSQIRRAERENPEISWGGEDVVRDFYGVFARSMHELGTPVYPIRFFEYFLQAMGPLARVLVIRLGGRVHAAALIVWHGARVEVPWAAATGEGKRMSLNMRLYWEMLRYSVAAGATAFDFGRSTADSGTFKFKQQWGAVPRQLHWSYCLPPGAAIPQINHSNPKYARVIALWQRMPLWCANLIGPHIAGKLP